MLQNYNFDMDADISQVEQGLSIDLSKAIEEGVDLIGAPSTVSGNDIEDPSTITGCIKDQFTALDRQRELAKQGRAARKQVDIASKQTVVTPAGGDN